jgi:hypothetical protein
VIEATPKFAAQSSRKAFEIGWRLLLPPHCVCFAPNDTHQM